MFNFWPDNLPVEVKAFPTWTQTSKESRRNYIKTNRYRICIDYVEFVVFAKEEVQIYVEGRKDQFVIMGPDAKQFKEAWEASVA